MRAPVEKACACVVQAGRVLVFRHPLAGVQLPKGTIDPGESPERAVLRELAEESGLVLDVVPEFVARFDVLRQPNGFIPGEAEEWQRWHVFALRPSEPLPERWQHTAHGSPEEDGLVFDYFWHPLGEPLLGEAAFSNGAFARAVALVAERTISVRL
ncbi:MAG: NUDIX domain-containing protein [Burkholderiales bacterium]|nr:NUDIX domain-containing protein [Burkholderiales bacterium]